MTHPTDALRLVPKYYATEPKEGGGGGYWEASIELTGGDYVAAEIYGNDREEVEERLKAALSGLLAAPASPLPGGGWQDISTAPRTGEEFQAWWKGTWQPRARFDPEYGSFQLWGRTDFDTEGWEVFEIDGYWQPQPAAPTGEPK